MSKPVTAESVRSELVEHISRMVEYWANLPGLGVEDRCDGVAFSVLTALDGAAALPRFTLSVESDGVEYPDGLVINATCDMHDAYTEYRRSLGK